MRYLCKRWETQGGLVVLYESQFQFQFRVGSGDWQDGAFDDVVVLSARRPIRINEE